MKKIAETSHDDHYEMLLASLDALCRGLYTHYGPEISCKEGCSSCCIAGISVFPVEAWYIKKNIPPSFAGNPCTGSCIFLNSGLCTVYHARPVLCRTQGFPLLYRSEAEKGHLELSACEQNFNSTKEFSVDHVINMEKVNISLAAVNIRFLQDSGRYEEYKNRRFLLEEIFSLKW